MLGFESLAQLDTLNMNQNLIETVSGLAPLAKLNTLLLKRNHLKNVASLTGLKECPSISVLDLSENQIEDGALVDLLVLLPNLKVLYLQGNPVCGRIPQYRKTLIARVKTLTYLDERPVSDEERRLAEAWLEGGLEAEKKERDQQHQDRIDRALEQHLGIKLRRPTPFRSVGSLSETLGRGPCGA